jgi:hypothetical protein
VDFLDIFTRGEKGLEFRLEEFGVPEDSFIAGQTIGELNDASFGSRMRGEGLFAQHIAQLFSISCRRAGMGEGRFPKLSTAAFRGGGGAQPDLFS